MHAIRTQNTTRSICLFLIVALLMTIAPVGLVMAAPGSDEGTASVLVFPVLDETESGIEGLGHKATIALESAINNQKGFSATRYSKHSALVGRAVSEGRLREVDVEAGETAAKGLALFIANVIGMDYVVLASINSVDIQEDGQAAKVILAGQSYAVKGNVDEASGEVVEEPKVDKAFGTAGESSPRAGYEGGPGPLISEAMRGAAHKAAATLAGKPPTDVTPKAQQRGTGMGKWLPYIIAVAVLALGVASANKNDPAPGPAEQATPITNLSIEGLQTNIRLTWNAPTGTTLEILRYEIWRNVDGAGFSILPVTVGPDAVGYTDTGVLTGTHTYQYRVRVLYTSGVASEYKYTGNLTFTR
ncbi:MAG TPA: hypothetical protein DGT21_00895 [Armatimonadetes bacterium]|jgi:hypothetical protein|nr:hypothetical protein [Armatimonadota bacterium]